MNIDLMRARDGEIGIVCNGALPALPQVVLFDSAQGTISLEYGADEDALMCNIAVANDWRVPLSLQDTILIGCIDKDTLLMADRVVLRSYNV